MTRLYAHGDIKKEGIIEVSPETSLEEVLQMCEGYKEGLTGKAVCLGGENGHLYTTEQMQQSVGSFEETGEIEFFSEKRCMVKYVTEQIKHCVETSCGKCVFGREGGYQMYQILLDITTGKAKKGSLDTLKEIAQTTKVASHCEHGREMPNLILSGLAAFPEEFKRHETMKRCDALECNAYVNFFIVPNLCTACGDCVDECEEDAIIGKRKMIHIIDQDECIHCGKCVTACEEGAIQKFGVKKPQVPKRPVPVGSWDK